MAPPSPPLWPRQQGMGATCSWLSPCSKGTPEAVPPACSMHRCSPEACTTSHSPRQDPELGGCPVRLSKTVLMLNHSNTCQLIDFPCGCKNQCRCQSLHLVSCLSGHTFPAKKRKQGNILAEASRMKKLSFLMHSSHPASLNMPDAVPASRRSLVISTMGINSRHCSTGLNHRKAAASVRDYIFYLFMFLERQERAPCTNPINSHFETVACKAH